MARARRIIAGAIWTNSAKIKEPENPNFLIIWWVDPTRNDPRLHEQYGKIRVIAANPETPYVCLRLSMMYGR